MSVCNVKVKYIRPQYQNLKEWCEDPNNVYIGRQGVVFVDKERYPKRGSIFANPFKVGKDGDRDEVCEKYRVYVQKRIDTEFQFREELENLRGKTLGCWCKPERCHGDILLEILNNLK